MILCSPQTVHCTDSKTRQICEKMDDQKGETEGWRQQPCQHKAELRAAVDSLTASFKTALLLPAETPLEAPAFLPKHH